jgi:hypothetical protein
MILNSRAISFPEILLKLKIGMGVLVACNYLLDT